MNAKHRPCMKTKLFLMLGALFCAQLVPAQESWREGRNVAGVAQGDETGHTAQAGLFGKYTSGGFRAPSMGKSLITAGVAAQSESRFKNLYLTGNFGFELVHGSQMMGSMFAEPGYYPVDLLEFTPGTKVRQTYDIGGGLAWKNDSRWTPGATARFRGVNYAKRKDLRHTTYRQEIEVAPSVLYRGDSWKAGVSLVFEKTSEQIRAEQVGADPVEPYMAFLDKGIRYGVIQVWDGSGIHLKESGVDGFPVKEYTWGAAVQGEWGDFLYADLEMVWSRGQVGEKGYTWFQFPGQKISAKVIGIVPSASGAHVLRADFSWFAQDNYEVVVDKVTQGGVTTPVTYGNNRIFQRRTLEASTAWEFTHRKDWSLGAEILVTRGRDRCSIMYPFLDNDESTEMLISVQGRVRLGAFDLAAALMGGSIIGTRGHVVDNADPSLGVSSVPYRLQEWWDKEQEVTDAPRLGLTLALRYNLPIKVPLYIEAGCNWVHAFGVKLLPGCDRQTSYLTLGYSF